MTIWLIWWWIYIWYIVRIQIKYSLRFVHGTLGTEAWCMAIYYFDLKYSSFSHGTMLSKDKITVFRPQIGPVLCQILKRIALESDLSLGTIRSNQFRHWFHACNLGPSLEWVLSVYTSLLLIQFSVWLHHCPETHFSPRRRTPYKWRFPSLIQGLSHLRRFDGSLGP